MLGLLRFFMASCVVVFHLTLQVPNIGLLSVNFFYVISGYLITMVLNDTYEFRFKEFATNRFLRLYPSYFFILLIGIFSSALTGFSSFHPSWGGPAQTIDIAGNILMFPWAFLADPINHVNFTGLEIFNSSTPHYRIIPSTWSVGIEICCYFILWLYTGKSIKTAIKTIALASIWHFFVDYNNQDPVLKYYPIPAALLPFGLGALAYHISKIYSHIIKPRNNANTQSMILAACITLFLANWLATTYLSVSLLNSSPYYINTAIAFMTVLAVNKSRLGGTLGKADKLFGDMAYPLFLCHFVFAFIATKLFDIAPRGWESFVYGYILSIIASYITIQLVDKPISKIRDKIREQGIKTKPAHNTSESRY